MTLASNKNDLVRLAARMNDCAQRPALSAGIVAMGLMTGWIWRWFKLVAWVRRGDWREFVYAAMIRFPDVRDDLLRQTIHHMLTGTDREDKTSVGGFSQREIIMIEKLLEELEK